MHGRQGSPTYMMYSISRYTLCYRKSAGKKATGRKVNDHQHKQQPTDIQTHTTYCHTGITDVLTSARGSITIPNEHLYMLTRLSSGGAETLHGAVAVNRKQRRDTSRDSAVNSDVIAPRDCTLAYYISTVPTCGAAVLKANSVVPKPARNDGHEAGGKSTTAST